MKSEVITGNQLRRGDYGWLALAMLMHAALLLVPTAERVIREGAGPTRQVSVSFVKQPDSHTETRQEPLPQAPDLVDVQARKRPIPENAPPAGIAEPPKTPTAQQLIESTRRIERFPEKSRKLRLGEFAPPPPPRNWQPSIRMEGNALDGMVLPEKTEIVDRWLAADGSHNVVVRTPGGMTLCGRAQPWDPMRPLVEPVMMYRECGGGGKRTFTMPERYQRRNR